MHYIIDIGLSELILTPWEYVHICCDNFGSHSTLTDAIISLLQYICRKFKVYVGSRQLNRDMNFIRSTCCNASRECSSPRQCAITNGYQFLIASILDKEKFQLFLHTSSLRWMVRLWHRRSRPLYFRWHWDCGNGVIAEHAYIHIM